MTLSQAYEKVNNQAPNLHPHVALVHIFKNIKVETTAKEVRDFFIEKQKKYEKIEGKIGYTQDQQDKMIRTILEAHANNYYFTRKK